jgi:hypothetical protein
MSFGESQAMTRLAFDAILAPITGISRQFVGKAKQR